MVFFLKKKKINSLNFLTDIHTKKKKKVKEIK